MATSSLRKGELTRQAIVEHAARMASRIGLEGLTIGALAEELKLSKSGLFAHFKSKEALQLQALEFGIGRFVDTVVRPPWPRRGESRGCGRSSNAGWTGPGPAAWPAACSW